MTGAYYNEHDPFAAAWLRELITAGHIAPGDVDERSIEVVQPNELAGYTQCHFFAGIGVWSYALRCAGWPDATPVWTGSCPCQSFSASGKRGGFSDRRHLWPTWFRLLRECCPDVVLGSRLQALTASRGSTLFRLTWKERVTPSGRRIFALRASARRTSGNASTSWPAPNAQDGEGGGQAKRATNPERSNDLPDFAQLANWPSPQARDHFPAHTPEYIAAKKAQGHGMANLNDLVQLAAWPSPTSTDALRMPGEDFTTKNITLNHAASWAMPAARDVKGANLQSYQNRGGGKKGEQLANQVVHSGPTSNGSPAPTEKRGQLNPAFSLWLQGLPDAWACCGEWATHSVRRSPRRSSKRIAVSPRRDDDSP